MGSAEEGYQRIFSEQRKNFFCHTYNKNTHAFQVNHEKMSILKHEVEKQDLDIGIVLTLKYEYQTSSGSQ